MITETANTITGLEQWASPVLYITGAATALAACLTAARFKASAHSDFAATRLITSCIIAVCGTICVGIGILSATIMAPMQNHLFTGAVLWVLSSLPPAIICWSNHKS